MRDLCEKTVPFSEFDDEWYTPLIKYLDRAIAGVTTLTVQDLGIETGLCSQAFAKDAQQPFSASSNRWL